MLSVALATVVADLASFERHLGPSLEHLPTPIETRVIRVQGCAHLAKVYNEMILRVESDYLILAHPDVSFGSAFLDDLEQAIAGIPVWGALGIVGRAWNGDYVWAHRIEEAAREVCTLDSCLAVVDRRWPLRFDEETFTGAHYAIEDYCLLAKCHGRPTYVFRSEEVGHEGASTRELWWQRQAGHQFAKLEEKWRRIFPGFQVT
jgi:hypothetical protein